MNRLSPAVEERISAALLAAELSGEAQLVVIAIPPRSPVPERARVLGPLAREGLADAVRLAVAEKLNVPYDWVTEHHKRHRTTRAARARYLAMAVIREVTGASYPTIGRLFRHDHTTIMRAQVVVGADAELREACAGLVERFRAGSVK